MHCREAKYCHNLKMKIMTKHDLKKPKNTDWILLQIMAFFLFVHKIQISITKDKINLFVNVTQYGYSQFKKTVRNNDVTAYMKKITIR